MAYSLHEVLGCTNSTSFAERYSNFLDKKSEGQLLLAELVLSMDNLENAKASWFEKFDTSVLIDFLIISHRYYSDSVLPSIERQLEVVVKQYDCPELLSEFGFFFYREFRTGLLNHFQYEEEQLFPFISDNKELRSKPFNEEGFRKGHPQPQVDLKGMIMLMNSAGKSKEQSMSFRILHEKLHSLQKELSLHEFIEENVLMERLRGKSKR
jgi:iron-sulfur cluster repair protein YtfE (RIC family)